LYYEIYCHQQRSDQLLLDVIHPILTEYKSGIKQWFFIRYNEGGDHIRLRIRAKSVLSGIQIMHALSNALHEDIQTGIIADLQLKRYKREMGFPA
jgi:thiopeptide-type bacteriocin biosynthesis protein